VNGSAVMEVFGREARTREERKKDRTVFHNQWQVGNFSLKSQEKQGVKVLLDLY
jgi:hypothetical protein